MKKVDRLKELEKIAEKLGIGQNREVKCVGCGKIIELKDAVILTDKKKVTYLCRDCYKKLEEGELDKKQIGTDDILKEIDKIRKTPGIQPAPYRPEPIPWETEPDWRSDRITWELGENICCSVSSLKDKLLKFEPNYGDRTSSNT